MNGPAWLILLLLFSIDTHMVTRVRTWSHLVTTIDHIKRSIRFLYRIIEYIQAILKSVMLISYYRMRKYANRMILSALCGKLSFSFPYRYFDLCNFSEMRCVTKLVDIDAAETAAHQWPFGSSRSCYQRFARKASSWSAEEKVRFLLPIKGRVSKVRISVVWHCMKGLGESSDRAT